MRIVINHIIDQLTQIQEGKIWIGNTYESKLSKVDVSLFFVRPLEDMHSIAEIFSHITLWRKEAILKIKGWSYIKSEYDTSLQKLINLLKEKEDNFLDELYYDTYFKGDYTYSFLINGMLHHDIYHLGQLGIIIKYLNL